MNRFAFVLILSAAMGFSAWATPAAAFDTNSESAINPDGSSRDSVYFSILHGEWPAVKERLRGMLERDGSSTPQRSKASCRAHG